MNRGSYYGNENGTLYSIEKITLAEDLTFYDFKDVKGKFFIEVLNPGINVKTEEAKTINRGKYKQSNFVELDISPYILVNCINAKIRTLYIDGSGYLNINNGRPIRLFSMEFKKADSIGYKIPKGTQFLCEFISGSTSIEDYRVLGTAVANPQIEEVSK